MNGRFRGPPRGELTVGKKRTNRWEFAFGAGSPSGRRSMVWKAWSPVGTSDVYVRTIRGQDAKVSLHDPHRAVNELPWSFAMTNEYMANHNDARLHPDRTVVRWGPFRGYPDGLVAALQILVPESELRIAPDAPPKAAQADYWLNPIPEEQAARFLIAFTPAGAVITDPAGWALIARHALSNGRDLLVLASASPLGESEATVLERCRTGGPDLIYSDLATRRHLEESFVRSGQQTIVGLQPLPPAGHLVTILEFLGISFYGLT